MERTGKDYESACKMIINVPKIQTFSGGLEYCSGAFYLDAAFAWSKSSSDYYLYGTENVIVNPVKNDFDYFNLMFTFGYRFE